MRNRNPKLFEASYSTLSAWERGDWDRAIKMYFGLETEVTEAMKQGKIWHKKFEEETIKTGCCPIIFGGQKLPSSFKTEIRFEKPVAEWLQLNGVIDLQFNKTIVDYKTGVSSASGHQKQLGIYQLAVPEAKVGVIKHFNQYNRKTESVYYHLTPKTMKTAYNWLITNASEMYQYLEENNIYQKVKETYGEI